ncbi:malate synthase A [Edaphobacter bradus]|uniref:malate synthase A n=1 Tax=Edaphobacter bradus TaxID=2259016 RepID=UPI0021E05C1F|nr:malate synthase A [Edaphobacter bradus]
MSTATQIIDSIDSASEREILTPEARDFLNVLDQQFEARRVRLLNDRKLQQAKLDRGELPDFPAATEHIRTADWTVAPIPADLLDRRVEITGPPDRKMVINALNSGANVFMADFEDSNSPTWNNGIEGQRNLRDANQRTIEYSSPEGKHYQLGPNPAVLFVRPRGWHMVEKHFLVAGAPISASLFDFGLYFFHNFRTLLKRGTAPYFYLPKLESHQEARLWNDVFLFVQEYVGIPKGTIRATVLIETIPAAFEMDEILYELRDHSAGLNCGRWDYIFSFIKKFSSRPDFVLPERGVVTMEQPFLRSYVERLIHTCHRRGIHAMGGMAAQIPIRNNPQANEEAMERVRQDKLREVRAGHDGTWVAHPGLVPIARAVFDEYMKGKNQITPPQEKFSRITAKDLLELPQGHITEAGLERNVDVALQYIESWLRGNGCVPIYNLMEDAATAEISRVQLWQWVRYGAHLDDGRQITLEFVEQTLDSVLNRTKQSLGAEAYAASKFEQAAKLLRELATGRFEPFLTTVAYNTLEM